MSGITNCYQRNQAAAPSKSAATPPIWLGEATATPDEGDAVAAEADAEADLEAETEALADAADDADADEAEADANADAEEDVVLSLNAATCDSSNN